MLKALKGLPWLAKFLAGLNSTESAAALPELHALHTLLALFCTPCHILCAASTACTGSG